MYCQIMRPGLFINEENYNGSTLYSLFYKMCVSDSNFVPET